MSDEYRGCRCREIEVGPRLLWPIWRWMTLGGAPSRAMSRLARGEVHGVRAVGERLLGNRRVKAGRKCTRWRRSKMHPLRPLGVRVGGSLAAVGAEASP